MLRSSIYGAAARKPGGTAREIELLQQEAARLRSEASVSADEFHARYQAETKRLAASAANVDEYMKVIASQIVEAKKIRERLKQP